MRLLRQIRDEEEAGVAEEAVAGVAAEQQVERDEDGDLDQQRAERGERVDLVLLVIGERLALQPFRVLLVLLPQLLQLRHMAPHLTLGVELATDQRQGAGTDQKGQADDRQAPAEADRVQVLEQPFLDVAERGRECSRESSRGRLACGQCRLTGKTSLISMTPASGCWPRRRVRCSSSCSASAATDRSSSSVVEAASAPRSCSPPGTA